MSLARPTLSPTRIIALLAMVLAVLAGSLGAASTADAGGGTKVRIKLRVLLEGSVEENDNLMRTDLWDMGLLPTTDPYGSGDTLSISNPTARRTPVDWVRVELRDSNDPTILVADFSGVVRADGKIVGSDGKQPRLNLSTTDQYHAVVFHKSHLPVASPALAVSHKKLTFDWRDSDVGTFFGAHQVEPLDDGRWTMIAGNAVQDSAADERDINGSDVQAWEVDNGTFGQYLPTDFDMNGDVNGDDKIMQQGKNGLFVFIPF